MDRTNRSPSRGRGFTLIELLVVVAIIALLISILLPSLGAARKIAKTVACSAKIKAINLAMTMYASEWNGAILGNVHTSGAFMLDSTGTAIDSTWNDDNLLRINQCFDWTAPVAKYMNIAFDEGPKKNSNRYSILAEAKAFACPENDILGVAFRGVPGDITEPLLSYNTAMAFQYEWKSGASSADAVYSGFSTFKFPGYRPRIDLVGNPASKVFLADGAKYWNSGQPGPPNVNIYFNGGGSPGGYYADWGPFNANTRSYNYVGTTGANGLSYAMRHGARDGKSLATSKFNVGFFDNHVETMTGLQGADPAMWAPKGASIDSSEAVLEAASRYMSGTMLVP